MASALPLQVVARGAQRSLVAREVLGEEAEQGMTSATYEFEVTLALGEADGPGFAVDTLSFTATGGTAEAATMHETLRLFLGAITSALHEAQADTPPASG